MLGIGALDATTEIGEEAADTYEIENSLTDRKSDPSHQRSSKRKIALNT
jgi:hypothetical protein